MSAELELAAEAPVTLFRTDDPGEVIARATETADALAAVVKAKNLTVRIGQGEHVKVEGWTMLGSLLGVFPICVWTRRLPPDESYGGGWEARVEARTKSGELVGAAEAMCTYYEKNWKTRDDFALRSMAQTRATSKALRLPLGFVMTLAGFEAIPAEEMPNESGAGERNTAQSAATGGEPAPAPATPAQVKKAYTVLGIAEKVAGLILTDYAQLLVSRYGTSHFSELSKSQASEVIDELEAMERDAAIPF